MKYRFLLLLVVLVNPLSAQMVDTLVNRRVDSLVNVSWDFKNKRDFTNALKINSFAEIIAIENLGRESAAYAKVCQNYGAIYFNQGNYEDAELKFLESIDLRKKVLGQQHPDLATSLNSLGVLYLIVGDYDSAEPLLLKTREIREKSLGNKHLEYAAILNNLAMLYNKLGQFDKSEVNYKESKEIRKQIFGNMHSEYASSLNNLAILYLDIGNYKLAEPLFLEAKMIRKKILGEEHPEYASTLNNLGVLYWKLGNHEAATKYYLESMTIRKKILGEKHPSYSASLNNLAIIYNEMGELEKAEEFYLESLHIIEKSKGKENSDYAWLLNNLAVNYNMKGEYDKSMPLLEETKLIREKVNGREHPDYANSISNIADLYCKMDNLSEAEPLYLEALRIIGLSLGEDHPDYANLLSSLANYYYFIGKFTEAIPYLLKGVEVEKRFIQQAAQYLSELEIAKYMDNFVAGQIGCFTYAQRFNDLSDVCYDNTLFYKGYLLNAVAQLNNIEVKDSFNSERIRMLKSHHRRLAAEFVLPIHERDSIGISQLQEKVNELEKEIKRNVIGFSEVLKQVYWKDVQMKLNNKEDAAVEFVHYEFAPDSLMYAAIVILPNIDKPIFITLFEEKQLTKLYLPKNERHARDVLAQNYSRGATPIQGGFEEGLYELIWKPFDSILIDVKTIYYSPSGLLHRINFDAIPTNKNEHLSDRFKLVRLGSTRTLVFPGLTRIDSSDKAMLFGGIQYNIDTTLCELDTFTKNLLASTNNGLSFSNVEMGFKERGMEWGYLSGTEEEVAGVSKFFEKSNFSTFKSSGYAATEDYFKLIGKSQTSPRVLHIATHGFFFPDPDRVISAKSGVTGDPDNSGGTASNPNKISGAKTASSNPKVKLEKKEAVFKMSDHPMIRSGLILAGGNYAWMNGKPFKDEIEDGILTAYEISQMNLSNTELVVLSACETGLGDIQGNEGVYGLQRAFKIAGVKYIIMSLWQVPDKQTSLLMTTFYKKWLEERLAIPDAFHAAQKEMRDIGLDPYNWAGFVLVE